MQRTEDYIREFTQICFAQKGVIIGTTLLFTAVAVLIYLFWPPTYAADGSVLLKARRIQKSPETLEAAEFRVFDVTMQDLRSEQEIIRSKDVVEGAVKRMAENNQYFSTRDAQGDALANAMSRLQANLLTEVVPESNVINVQYQDKNSKRALAVLENIMSAYMAYRSGLYYPVDAKGFFTEQTEKFGEQLRDYEDQLVELSQQSNTPDPQKEIENNLAIKAMLEQNLDMTRNDWIEKDLYVKHLQESLKNEDLQFFSFVENPSIQLLAERLQDLVLERGGLLRIYASESDKIVRIDEQIEETYETLKTEMYEFTQNQVNELQILRDKIESLELRLEQINARNVELRETGVEQQRIVREIELLNENYDTFSKRREEAIINSRSDAAQLFQVAVLAQPSAGGKPVFPTFAVIPVGLVVGLITGFTLAFLREYFDHTFKKPEDVAKFADLPTIMSIPHWEQP